MSAAHSLTDAEPVLRALAPTLHGLENGLRSWLDAKHAQPLTVAQSSRLGRLADDLGRQSDALEQEQPLLIVVLMGGTGVGKSTLLNALAGAPIAQASFARPTTRDPVVYLHETVSATKLDPALQVCRLASHDRANLKHKVLVDTPDIDSNDLGNREKLFQVLPVADVVLYVGSQEKYHDQLGWEAFLEQKKRRAFAFVLNKWDRCQNPGAGTKPDEDWIRDLKASGFESPVLFRTCAQHWVDQPWQGVSPPPSPPVPGEQFLELVRWLEQGLSRLEIEAIKARGVGQLLGQLDDALTDACPPDLSEKVERCRPVWTNTIRRESAETTEVLLTTLDPYQQEIEKNFAERRRLLFTGPMGGYLTVVHKLRYLGSGGWKSKIPWVPTLPTLTGSDQSQRPPDFNLAAFLRQCSLEASERHLESRHKAFANRLVLEAESVGLPLALLNERIEPVAAQDWKTRHAEAMYDVLQSVERAWSAPGGARKWIHRGIIFLGNTLPSVALLAMAVVLLWKYFMAERTFASGDLLLPLAVVLLTMVILHVLIAVLIPMRWLTLRAEFGEELKRRLEGDLAKAYDSLPKRLADDLLGDRERVLLYQSEVRETIKWLQGREKGASVDHLFG